MASLSLLYALLLGQTDAVTIDTAVQRHQAGLDRWGAVEVQLSAYRWNAGERVPLMDVRWRRAGGPSRFTETIFAGFGEDGQFEVFDKPVFIDRGIDGQELRILENWDPLTSYELPLRPGGKNAWQYGRVRGTILRGDQLAGSSGCLFWLQLAVTPGQTLIDLHRAGQIESILHLDGQEVLEIDLKEMGRARCFVDPSRSWLVSRTEHFAPGVETPATILEVEEFQQVGSDNLWFPYRVVMYRGLETKPDLEIEVHKAAVRLPESQVGAVLQFPEGCRVDDPLTGAIHIWGTDGPRLTFGVTDNLVDWEERSAAGIANLAVPARKEAAPPWLWQANLVLLIVAAALFALRRFLSTKRS